MGSVDAALSHLLGEFSKQQQEFSVAQAEITELTATEDGPRHLFTVVVGNGGEIRELKFHNRDYRELGPEDLSKALVDAVTKAQTSLRDKIHASLTAVTSRADSMANMLSDDFDLSSLMPEGFGFNQGNGSSNESQGRNAKSE